MLYFLTVPFKFDTTNKMGFLKPPSYAYAHDNLIRYTTTNNCTIYNTNMPLHLLCPANATQRSNYLTFMIVSSYISIQVKIEKTMQMQNIAESRKL